MFFITTTSIRVRSSRRTFLWTYTSDERSHFKSFGRQQTYKKSFTPPYKIIASIKGI